MIGSALKNALSKTGLEVWTTTRSCKPVPAPRTVWLDLSDPGDFYLPVKPNSALLCAARTNVLDCEQDPDSSRNVNVRGIQHVARLLLEEGAFVIFLSSSAVFDGVARAPHEDALLSATTEYGKQKQEAEDALLELNNGGSNVAIVRPTKVLSSRTGIGRKFLEHLKCGETVDALSDYFLSPISLKYVVNALLEIEKQRIGGVFHLSGSEELSYAELARRFATKLNASADLVRDQTVETLGQSAIYRPIHPALGMALTTRTLGLHPEPLDAMLDNVLADFATERWPSTCADPSWSQ